MKKLLSLILILSLCSVMVFAFVGCDNNNSTPKPTYTVTFHYLNTVRKTLSVEEGDIIGDRLRQAIGNSNMGKYAWYTSKVGNIEWNIYADRVYSDMDLWGRDA